VNIRKKQIDQHEMNTSDRITESRFKGKRETLMRSKSKWKEFLKLSVSVWTLMLC